MPKLVTPREMIRALKQLGFQELRIIGSHHRFAHADGRKTSVPIHGNEPIGAGLLNKIIKKDFRIDVTADMQRAASLVLNADKTGAIILGGGISKHHTIGLNILREGLDYAVYISTASEFDGSLSGAQTHEAKSWGKISEQGKTVNVNCDATIAFPLICAALKEKRVL